MDQDTLTALVAERLTIAQISDRTSRSKTNVRYWLKKYGLRTFRGAGAKGQVHNVEYRCSCGQTDPAKFYGAKKRTCAKCHSAYTTKKGKENRLKIIDHLGGRCVDCGFSGHPCALDVHHLDPSKKDPAFGTHRGWSWQRIESEISSCVLLCKNCHAIRHEGLHLEGSLV